MITIEVYKASPTPGDEDVEGVLIQANQSVPDMPLTTDFADWNAANNRFFIEQATELYRGLKQLPQGTLDRLFALMAADKASGLHIQGKEIHQ